MLQQQPHEPSAALLRGIVQRSAVSRSGLSEVHVFEAANRTTCCRGCRDRGRGGAARQQVGVQSLRYANLETYKGEIHGDVLSGNTS